MSRPPKVECPFPYKQAYRTKAAAEREQRRARIRRPLVAYRCPCGAFHLGRAFQ